MAWQTAPLPRDSGRDRPVLDSLAETLDNRYIGGTGWGGRRCGGAGWEGKGIKTL